MNPTPDESLDPDAQIVTLTDEQGRSLPCYVERTTTVHDVDYVLLLPVDSPIEVFAWEPDEDSDEEEVLVDIDEEWIDDIFPLAQAVLAEQNLILQRSGFTLTVSGELPEPEDDDVITLDVGETDGEFSSEQLQFLANFFHKDQEYAIYTPLYPLLFFAQVTATGELKVLSPEEFQAVKPYLAEDLFDELDDE